MKPRAWSTRLLAALLTLSALAGRLSAGEEGFVSLFNGKDLSGWEGDTRYWSVEDGAITGKTTPDNLLEYNTFLIWKGGMPDDFELRVKYRIKGGNSGVQYRSRVIDEAKFVVGGYQADIDSGPRYTGMNYEEKGRTFLAQRGERVVIGPDGKKTVEPIRDKDALQAKVKDEEWNQYVIVARGSRLTHLINGSVMSEVIDNEKGKAAASGVIAFQVHQGPPMIVQFKDIELREFK